MSSSPTELVMPQMGVSVSEGTVVEWRKQVGDRVERDEVVCSISTDKIDTDVESPAAGTLTEIRVQPGETVDVGTVLAVIDGLTAVAAPAPAAPTAGAPEPRRRRYSPVVMRIAEQHDIDLSAVEGTGRDGRVRKQDVLALVESSGANGDAPLHIDSPYKPDPPAAPQPVQGLSRIRRTIGEHMLRSLRTAATCTTVIEVDMSRVEAERARLGITALPIVARATVDTLRRFPALNATLDGERYERHAGVHLGIAVSLGEEGLIVPVIRDAQEFSAEGLATRIRDAAGRARAGTLEPDEVRGGTFTITNPGQYGSILATPVINQPQVAILDTEAVVKRPVVVTDAAGNDAIAIRPMAYFCLSWDHRALDGAEAAKFLGALRAKLEAL